jgi:hypothetical protein
MPGYSKRTKPINCRVENIVYNKLAAQLEKRRLKNPRLTMAAMLSARITYDTLRPHGKRKTA